MEDVTSMGSQNPVILLATWNSHDRVAEEFAARYSRDYQVEAVSGAENALQRIHQLVEAGVPLAMVASESTLDDRPGLELLAEVRTLCPTARRVALLDREDYAQGLEAIHAALSARVIDTFTGIPRGARDEEFHAALTDLLSEWGWTVATPEVTVVDIIVGSRGREAYGIRDVLERMGVPNRVLQGDEPEALEILDQLPGAPEFPVVRTVAGSIIENATANAIAESIYGGFDDIPEGTVVDVAVVGGGPAGLAAAVYATSEGLDTVVIESEAVGGQAGTSSMIRNYLGFPNGVSGMRLTQRARFQAGRFGARFFTGRAVTFLEPGPEDEPPHHHVFVGETHLCARTVVVATGVNYRRLGVPSVDSFVGVGVYYGAATSLAREMVGKRVCVVGGGNSAGQAAVHMAKFAEHVTIAVRRTSLEETMSAYLIRELEAIPNVTIRSLTRVVDGGGDGALEWLDFEHIDTGEVERHTIEGLFCLLGAEPDCSWLPSGVALDEKGYILTGRDVPYEAWTRGRPPANLETTVPGIFAVGDVRSGSMKRVASAAGEGASVLPLIHAHLAELRAAETRT